MEKYEKTYVNGQICMFEKEKIRVARIPISSDSWQGSVVIHPRYVPAELKYEQVDVTGLRIGRSIYILVEEPILINGIEYHVLNFKGVGAQANEPMTIHPTHWYDPDSPLEYVKARGRNGWRPRIQCDSHNRIFGAVRTEDGISELEAYVIQKLKIPYTPHVAFNELPHSILTEIGKVEASDSLPSSGQLIRACSTTIRKPGIRQLSEDEAYPYIMEFAKADAQFINNYISLVREGMFVNFSGRLEENQYINGVFTDEENYTVRSLDELDEVAELPAWLFFMLVAPTIKLLDTYMPRHYLKQLEESTQIPFYQILSRATSENEPLLDPDFERVNKHIKKAVSQAKNQWKQSKRNQH